MKGGYYFRGIGVFRMVVTVWHSVPPGTSVGTNSRKIISEKINVLPLTPSVYVTTNTGEEVKSISKNCKKCSVFTRILFLVQCLATKITFVRRIATNFNLV